MIDASAEVAVALTSLDMGDRNGDPHFENEELAGELWDAQELLRRATRALDRALDLE